MNVSDSERIAGFLEQQPLSQSPLKKGRRFVAVEDIKQADLVIFNTCGVRQSAENRVYGQIHNLAKINEQQSKNNKIQIILTGCLADRKDVQRRLKDKVDLFCNINDLPRVIASVAKPRPGGAAVSYLPARFDSARRAGRQALPRNDNYLCIAPKYNNYRSTYVPVMAGCNNFCSYCVVPYARGREISRPAEDIIAEIDKLAKNGCKEVTLLGQNVNSYSYKTTPALSSLRKPAYRRGRQGSNEKTKFSDWIPACAGMKEIAFSSLLNYIASNYRNIKFKFLTSHPKDFSDELINVIAKNKNISREIHLPVQSGSDKILKLMNRPYTRKIYLALIEKIQKKIPGAGFTTDVIVGFPGETENDFQKTVDVFKKVNYNEAYINKYSPRPGTAALKFGDPIPLEEKKLREKILRKLI